MLSPDGTLQKEVHMHRSKDINLLPAWKCMYMYYALVVQLTLTVAATESLVTQWLLKFTIPVAVADVATVQGDE